MHSSLLQTHLSICTHRYLQTKAEALQKIATQRRYTHNQHITKTYFTIEKRSEFEESPTNNNLLLVTKTPFQDVRHRTNKTKLHTNAANPPKTGAETKKDMRALRAAHHWHKYDTFTLLVSTTHTVCLHATCAASVRHMHCACVLLLMHA
jgi:hypothetical protein